MLALCCLLVTVSLSCFRRYSGFVVSFARVFAMPPADSQATSAHEVLATASQSPSSVAAPGASRGRKRNGGELKVQHSPWDTIPAHCADLVNGRSVYAETALSDFWEYIRGSTAVLQFRSECPVCPDLCSCACLVLCRFAGDVERQGVCLSRMAAIWAMECSRIRKLEDDPHSGLSAFLDRASMGEVFSEARRLLPFFKVLMATEEQKRASSRIDGVSYLFLCMFISLLFVFFGTPSIRSPRTRSL